MNWRAFTIFTSIGLLWGGSATQAGFLIGKPLRMTYEAPLDTVLVGPVDFVVGPGVEYDFTPSNFANLALDVSDTSILLDFTGLFFPAGVPFNGIRLVDFTGTIRPIIGVEIDAATNVAGFDAARLFFSENEIRINIQGLGFTSADRIVLNVVPAAVPEPSSLALLGTALSAMAFVGLRRKFKV